MDLSALHSTPSTLIWGGKKEEPACSNKEVDKKKKFNQIVHARWGYELQSEQNLYDF
jgi:hypothetical protein